MKSIGPGYPRCFPPRVPRMELMTDLFPSFVREPALIILWESLDFSASGYALRWGMRGRIGAACKFDLQEMYTRTTLIYCISLPPS